MPARTQQVYLLASTQHALLSARELVVLSLWLPSSIPRLLALDAAEAGIVVARLPYKPDGIASAPPGPKVDFTFSKMRPEGPSAQVREEKMILLRSMWAGAGKSPPGVMFERSKTWGNTSCEECSNCSGVGGSIISIMAPPRNLLSLSVIIQRRSFQRNISESSWWQDYY